MELAFRCYARFTGDHSTTTTTTISATTSTHHHHLCHDCRSGTDNSLSKRVLGLRYTPIRDTIRDTVASLIDTGFVPAMPVAKL